jgi:hypothetical protein
LIKTTNYMKSKEFGSKIDAFIKNVDKKFGDLKRGHTLQEEADVIRIINNPSSISREEEKKYRDKLCNDLFNQIPLLEQLRGANAYLNPSSYIQEKTHEIYKLTREQIIGKMIEEDARPKAEKWNLNLNA